MSDASITYDPKCLKVAKGATVKFAGNQASHPIRPSKRGDQTGSPIMMNDSGTDKSFTFSTPGFFAYYCNYHGSTDSGDSMAGVVWVTP